MIKHIEVKSIEYGDVKVYIRLDYDSGTVDLVEPVWSKDQEYKKKEWVFVGRGLEYMNGWLNIMEAMKKARVTQQSFLSRLKSTMKPRARNSAAVLL